ncbi:aminoglycoside 3'-phosphotransferase [Cohnella sp. REN36]|uniref:aminoglycoside 3'-phosphotransferase n=1 Tax=Cohnella sp. REN36 TaxID=2887347 RepID=UPI001D152D37|nr:aminoglycoside 3'-phosphotransferase [Cohnella sp. REN36]MCC3373789.1 aminoglycoside 3'-phosphotransferase [Cohnella sp. REN36]
MADKMRAAWAHYPEEIQGFLQGADIAVVKQKTRSVVLRLDRREESVFLKVTPKGQMREEARMTEYLSRRGACPRVILYRSDGTGDYLITSRVAGSDAAAEACLRYPERLTDAFAEGLSALHDVDPEGCPVVNGLAEMASRADRNYREGRADRSLLLYMGYADADTAYRDLIAMYETCEDRTDQVVIHGDYCLPNVIVRDFKVQGYIDVGYGGVGDRHYDLFWGLWSLRYNLRSDFDRIADRFLETYGRAKADKDRIRFCGLISVFNGFRGQDYYNGPL